MAFGKNMKRGNEEYGMGLVRSTSFGRKRIAFSNIDMEEFGENEEFMPNTTLKRQRSFLSTEKSDLENLPQEILIKILCGVEHDDLKKLFFVSKAIRDTTLIAKQTHFAYNTPRKTVGFRNVEGFGDFSEIEAPNAPKQCKVSRSRLTAKKLADISVALFSSGMDEDWPCRDLITEMEMVI